MAKTGIEKPMVNKFHVGDLVKLISGGPVMVVSKLDDGEVPGKTECSYFLPREDNMWDGPFIVSFPQDILEEAESES